MPSNPTEPTYQIDDHQVSAKEFYQEFERSGEPAKSAELDGGHTPDELYENALGAVMEELGIDPKTRYRVITRTIESRQALIEARVAEARKYDIEIAKARMRYGEGDWYSGWAMAVDETVKVLQAELDSPSSEEEVHTTLADAQLPKPPEEER